MAFTYKVEASLNPDTARSGDKVAMRAKFTDIEGEIGNVYVSEPNYGISFRLTAQGDGLYTGTAEVPYGAPSDTYTLNVYALSKENQPGPKHKISIRVLG